jgi:hypothetical protein
MTSSKDINYGSDLATTRIGSWMRVDWLRGDTRLEVAAEKKRVSWVELCFGMAETLRSL